jgi:outer membrane protein
MWFVAAQLLGSLLATSLAAQEARQLSLQEALEIAERNNPVYLRRANDQAAADWQVREAYASFLPSAIASGSAAYTEAGVQRIGTLDFGAQSTDWYSSSYSLSLNWTLDGRTLYALPSARANARSVSAGIDAARFNMQQLVTLQYMTALRARDAVRVALDQQERAAQNLEIVRTRVAAGAAAGTEAIQAEVTLGRAEIALLNAERDHRAERLRLMEQLGTGMDGDVELVSEFVIFEPPWSPADLITDAMARHPSLRSFRATEDAQGAQVKQAWSSYLPSLSLTTAFSGNALQARNEDFIRNSVEGKYDSQLASCQNFNAIDSAIPGGLPAYAPQDCSRYVYTPAIGDAALSQNQVFPFDFTKNPLTLQLRVSVPVFQGFSRQRQVEQAEAAARDAAHDLRAEELRLTTAITQALDDVRSAHRSTEIEARNLELARQQLEQARQRYAVGNTSILDLQDAETSLSTAERDYLNAQYGFHQALVVLEAATGRSLRPGGGLGEDDGAGADRTPLSAV